MLIAVYAPVKSRHAERCRVSPAQPTSLNILSWLIEDGKKKEEKAAFPGVPQHASCLEKRRNGACVGFLTAAAGLSHVQRAVCEWEAEWAG